MMYSSKQKLATAMAATMVVSMAPAMAFAAPLDDVVRELGKEDVTKAQAGDVTSAEAVLGVAKTFVAGDVKAQLLVEAYQASIDVFKATSQEDFAAKRAAFNAAVAKLSFLDVNGSFKSAKTVENHDKIGKKFEAPAVEQTIEGKLNEQALGNTVEITLPSADAVTEVMKDGAPAKYVVKNGVLKVVLGAGVGEEAKVTFKLGAVPYKVVIKK